jgi:hypothetical protein
MVVVVVVDVGNDNSGGHCGVVVVAHDLHHFTNDIEPPHLPSSQTILLLLPTSMLDIGSNESIGCDEATPPT